MFGAVCFVVAAWLENLTTWAKSTYPRDEFVASTKFPAWIDGGKGNYAEEGLRHGRAIANMMGGLDEEWTFAFAQAWLYGFQMGHDYVRVYGACLEEDRLPWGNATGG